MNLDELLRHGVESNASDLHLSAGLQPMIRVDGDLQKLDEPVQEHDPLRTMLTEIMDERIKRVFEQRWEVDFAYGIPDLARFRVNVFTTRRGVAAVFRTIPDKVFSFQELGLPEIFKDLAMLPHGLVVVTGPTGSGKSTSLASIIDYINARRQKHIITIEDPIEFVHTGNKCLINQREVHRDTQSFTAALRSALREDPDIILVGEMRDLETIRLALTAAETGHLVLATLHTVSAAKTVNRIIDAFPSGEKALVRTLLSESLQAVISQLLLKKIGGGRVASYEVMVCNPAIRNLIREDKVAQMYSAIQTGSRLGMVTLDNHLQSLVKDGTIDIATAADVAIDKSLFDDTATE